VRSQSAAAQPAESFVHCRIAGRPYAFDAGDVRFIARSDQVAPGGDGVGRVGTLRGREPIPVFALGALLHPSEPASDGSHVVITGSGEERAGWQVDRILSARREGAADRLALPLLAGPLARRWFSALLDENEGEPSLVCSPAGLDPRGSAHAVLADPPVQPAELAPTGAGRGVAALFSSPALPPCGASRYALAGTRIVAVVQSLPARVVPGTPAHVSAVAVWRGLAIPVLDASGGAGVPTDTSRSRYLIARHAGSLVAIPIERDVVLHRASHDDAPVTRPEGTPPGVQLFSVRGETVALVDLDSLTAAYTT
jgi:chemotaxis signal transduction protein